MKRLNFKEVGTAQLVQEFTALAIQQGDALLEHESAKVTRLYWAIDGINEELKARPGDQRAAFTSAPNHPNLQVRLKAAGRTRDRAASCASAT
jgi:hypothetical protein